MFGVKTIISKLSLVILRNHSKKFPRKLQNIKIPEYKTMQMILRKISMLKVKFQFIFTPL